MADNAYDLDTVLLDMQSKDVPALWTVRDAVEGLQIFGGIGSGKTSGSGRFVALKYLSHGFGGLVLTAKHDEKALWQEYCALAGRTDDLIIVEPGGKHSFNFLEYESAKAIDKRSLTLNLVQVLRTVIRANQERSGQRSDDSFWESALDMLLANAIDLCIIAYGKVTIKMLYDIVQSAPKKTQAATGKSGQNKTAQQQPPPKDAKEEKKTPFQEAYSVALSNVKNITEKWASSMTKEEKAGLTNAAFTRLAAEKFPEVRLMSFVYDFFENSFKYVADKTRSIIEFIFIGFLSGLLREPTFSLFCRYPSTFVPEDCLDGKIILLNIPVKDYHRVGQDGQILFKYIWQRAMERRRIADNSRPVFLWADEAQNFLHEHDANYQATARSSRIATVYISQNLPNYYASMGGDKAQYKVKSFLGTLGTKIFHANADIDTNEYASRMIGEAFVKDKVVGAAFGNGLNFNESESQKLQKRVRPEMIPLLKTGGPANDGWVEAYIHSQAKELTPGANYKKIKFNQNYSPQNKNDEEEPVLPQNV